jgi:lysophospholipase L1-like esterase
VFFVSTENQPYLDCFKAICAEINCRYLPNVAQKVTLYKKQTGQEVYIDGFHWNQVGHKVVASILLDQNLID